MIDHPAPERTDLVREILILVQAAGQQMQYQPAEDSHSQGAENQESAARTGEASNCRAMLCKCRALGQPWRRR